MKIKSCYVYNYRYTFLCIFLNWVSVPDCYPGVWSSKPDWPLCALPQWYFLIVTNKFGISSVQVKEARCLNITALSSLQSFEVHCLFSVLVSTYSWWKLVLISWQKCYCLNYHLRQTKEQKTPSEIYPLSKLPLSSNKVWVEWWPCMTFFRSTKKNSFNCCKIKCYNLFLYFRTVMKSQLYISLQDKTANGCQSQLPNVLRTFTRSLYTYVTQKYVWKLIKIEPMGSLCSLHDVFCVGVLNSVCVSVCKCVSISRRISISSCS